MRRSIRIYELEEKRGVLKGVNASEYDVYALSRREGLGLYKDLDACLK